MLKRTSSASPGSGRSGPRLPFCGGTEVGWRAATLLALALLSAVAGARQSGDRQSPETAHQKALREVAIAGAAAREVSQLSSHPDFRLAVSRDDEIEIVIERARRVLRAAESGLASAEQTQSMTGFSDSALLAKRATGTFEQCAARLRELFRQIETERSPPPPPPTPPPVEPEPSPAASETSPVGPPPGPAAEPSPASRVAPRPPAPRKLRQAADAYFAGDYTAAITLLSESTFNQSKSRAHALLLRAAARYALFLLGGETDYALRGQAADDVAACKVAAPDLVPDEGIFSPRFRDFFAATR